MQQPSKRNRQRHKNFKHSLDEARSNNLPVYPHASYSQKHLYLPGESVILNSYYKLYYISTQDMYTHFYTGYVHTFLHRTSTHISTQDMYTHFYTGYVHTFLHRICTHFYTGYVHTFLHRICRHISTQDMYVHTFLHRICTHISTQNMYTHFYTGYVHTFLHRICTHYKWFISTKH